MSSADIQGERPLSPHLTIYRPIPTMVASITHRITGAALYFGTLPLAWWLIAAASGESHFSYASAFMESFPGRLILFGFSWSLIQHMLGGIKHLFWDVGYGFDKHFATKMAWLTFAASPILTILVWLIVYATG